jgi:hypothetical protein
MQALWTPPAIALVLALCGERAAPSLTVVAALGVVVWLGVAVPYTVRHDGPLMDVENAGLRAWATALIGVVLPFLIALVAWRATSFRGVLFSTEAAAFAGVAFAVIPVAMLASSMVDRYLILPYCYGLFGPAIWSEDMSDRNPVKRRREYAKVWVAHRVVCEICCYFALAVFLAIVFVAAGNAVSSERTLAVALESLGGAGIAFSVIAYLGPRVRDGWNYMLAQNAGLGMWVVGSNAHGRFEGLVVDVSVHPGVKLRLPDGEPHEPKWKFVALAESDELSEADRPAGCTEAWCERAVRDREQADTRRTQPSQAGPPKHA